MSSQLNSQSTRLLCFYSKKKKSLLVFHLQPPHPPTRALGLIPNHMFNLAIPHSLNLFSPLFVYQCDPNRHIFPFPLPSPSSTAPVSQSSSRHSPSPAVPQVRDPPAHPAISLSFTYDIVEPTCFYLGQ